MTEMLRCRGRGADPRRLRMWTASVLSVDFKCATLRDSTNCWLRPAVTPDRDAARRARSRRSTGAGQITPGNRVHFCSALSFADTVTYSGDQLFGSATHFRPDVRANARPQSAPPEKRRARGGFESTVVSFEGNQCPRDE